MLLSTTSLLAQSKTPADPHVPIPEDRAADSYRIYSALIPVGETAGNGWPHDLWLIEDVTVTLVQPNQPCAPPSNAPGTQPFNASMNPHVAVQPPEDWKQDYAEILADFDLHCHDRLTFDPKRFNVTAPLRLLTPDQQKDFQAHRDRLDPASANPYKGAPALYGFSEVYFNARHTVALVYATQWCGNLCAQGFWVAFALKDGQWKPMQWSSTTWIS